jgi:hypothetical protein
MYIVKCEEIHENDKHQIQNGSYILDGGKVERYNWGRKVGTQLFVC